MKLFKIFGRNKRRIEAIEFWQDCEKFATRSQDKQLNDRIDKLIKANNRLRNRVTELKKQIEVLQHKKIKKGSKRWFDCLGQAVEIVGIHEKTKEDIKYLVKHKDGQITAESFTVLEKEVVIVPIGN